MKKKGGLILALLSLSVYIIMVITCLVFLSTVLLLPLLIVIPVILVSLKKKNKELTLKRVKASCWALGFVVLMLFPAFWLIPNQIYVRTNREKTLITPDAPAVESFAEDFLDDTDDYKNMSFEEKAEAANDYTMKHIKWRLDSENYGLMGHQATPTQCIELGSDDCQGQACTLASLLLQLEFDYVWVVETPFHWYVLVRDPDEGKLPAGWENKVEKYQENGEVITLNRDGEGNMPDYRLEEVQIIFNNEETLYPVNSFEAVFIGWTATGFYVHELFPKFVTYEIIFFIIGMLGMAVLLSAWTSYMSNPDSLTKEKLTKKNAKLVLLKSLILWPMLVGVFILWFHIQNFLWDYTLILSICEICLISSLASEPKFWKLIKIEKEN